MSLSFPPLPAQYTTRGAEARVGEVRDRPSPPAVEPEVETESARAHRLHVEKYLAWQATVLAELNAGTLPLHWIVPGADLTLCCLRPTPEFHQWALVRDRARVRCSAATREQLDDLHDAVKAEHGQWAMGEKFQAVALARVARSVPAATEETRRAA